MKNSTGLFPGAASLVLVLVVLAMSVLGMLSIMSANSDLALSERGASTAEEIYALQTQAEYSIAEIDAICRSTDGKSELALPDYCEYDGKTITWSENSSNRYIDITAEIADGGLCVTSYKQYTLMEGGIAFD